MQSNRITKIEGLEDLLNLEELYLSHNGLKKIEGLEKNVRLISCIRGSELCADVSRSN
jgi:protein phosphatase 1 regulatory subunit 7